MSDTICGIFVDRHWDYFGKVEVLKCDICGKFISWDEFDNNSAKRVLITPDSDYSCEEFSTYHVGCKEA
mgnify:CR=1 FL=1